MNINPARIVETMKSERTGKLLANENLAKYTSWRVGGPAKQMFFPADRNDLARFLAGLPEHEPLYWIGLGSNLLVRDGGINGTIINTRSSLKEMAVVAENKITVEAGVHCAQVARFCSKHGLTGAEFLVGIPGTLGGALAMNAGAFGGEIWEIVESVEMIASDGSIATRRHNEFAVSYRSVKSNRKEWFLAACLHLRKGSDFECEMKIRELLAKRVQTQPVNQLTCGSVFKNPESDFAARLIEASGLKGYSLGRAKVSEKHANFIVNTGKATAAEIENLIEYVRAEVEKRQGIRLQTEVRIIGEKVTV